MVKLVHGGVEAWADSYVIGSGTNSFLLSMLSQDGKWKDTPRSTFGNFK